MKAWSKQLERFFRAAVRPKSILLCLALLNFLAVPVRFGALCLYNWSGVWYVAFTVLIAALALWIGKWWSYIGAIVITSPVIYGFVYEFLKVFGFLGKSPEEAERWVTPEEWRGFFIENHPEETWQIVLVAVILCYAIICLGIEIFHKRRVLS